MKTWFVRFAYAQSGLTAIEYALIAAVIMLGIFSSVSLVGTTISTKFYGPLSAGLS